MTSTPFFCFLSAGHFKSTPPSLQVSTSQSMTSAHTKKETWHYFCSAKSTSHKIHILYQRMHKIHIFMHTLPSTLAAFVKGLGKTAFLGKILYGCKICSITTALDQCVTTMLLIYLTNVHSLTDQDLLTDRPRFTD